MIANKNNPFGNGFGFDDGGFATIQPQDLGLNLPYGTFVSLASAIIALPPLPTIAAGKLNNTPNGAALYWTDDPLTGLHVQAAPGFLTTATGDGGFSLNVTPNGAWALNFDGTNTVIGSGISQAASPIAANGLPGYTVPPGYTVMGVTNTGGAGSINASAGNIIADGDLSTETKGNPFNPTIPVFGYDTISGGVGDYMIGGTGTGGGGAGGDGNCANYATGSTLTAGSSGVLVDMPDDVGYGGNAEGNVYVNINQVRGSLWSNVEIGSPNGTDLKSGGNDSLLISLGGSGNELRSDGYGNVMVSTVGADFINFDPNHNWQYGDDNILLGFGHGDTINLGQIVAGPKGGLASLASGVALSGYSSAQDFSNFTSTSNINNYVKFVDQVDGDHLLYSPTGQVQSGVNTTEILDLKMTHGLSAASLYGSGQLLMATPAAYT